MCVCVCVCVRVRVRVCFGLEYGFYLGLWLSFCFPTPSSSVEQPKHHSADRFVLSKVWLRIVKCLNTSLTHTYTHTQGHACPILYAAWCEAGLLSKEHLLTLMQVDSVLEGHPTPVKAEKE